MGAEQQAKADLKASAKLKCLQALTEEANTIVLKFRKITCKIC